MDFLTDWIFDLLYAIQKTVCYIIDFIKEIFYTLAGIQPVVINEEPTDLLTHFILSQQVKQIFYGIFLIAVILLVVFVLIAVIRSEYVNSENKKSKSVIIGKASQSFLIFLLMPFLLISGIMFTNTVMNSVNSSMNNYVLETGEVTTIGGQILVTSGTYAYVGDESIRQDIELKFLTGEFDYFDTVLVKQYYSLKNMDYFIGIVSGIVIVVMFVMSAIMFIQRIFDIIFLYIISPISVSTIPLDEGNRFRIWKEMLIAKILSAYGIILSMNLFFIIMPQVQTITFFNDSFKNGIMQILFLIGGAFAVTKANIVVAQLTGNKAGNNETAQMISNMRTAGNLTKIGFTTALTGAGVALGGASFLKAKKQGGLSGGFKDAFKTKNSPLLGSKNELSKSSFIKKSARIATMPIGVMKDLVSGGGVGVGKSVGSKVKNIKSKDKKSNN
jgi:hypothetical protein